MDKLELEELSEQKSNKTDTEQLMKDVDIMHQQIVHMMVLLVEHLKTSLSSASKKARAGARQFLLSQAVRVCRWVHAFDPQHVNNEDLVMPADLRELSEHARTLIDYPKTDFVADIALRKHKVREQESSPSPTLPSKQMDKYVSTSLSNARGQGLVGSRQLQMAL